MGIPSFQCSNPRRAYTVQGGGNFTAPLTAFTLQTHAVPEPGSVMLVLLQDPAGAFREHAGCREIRMEIGKAGDAYSKTSSSTSTIGAMVLGSFVSLSWLLGFLGFWSFIRFFLLEQVHPTPRKIMPSLYSMMQPSVASQRMSLRTSICCWVSLGASPSTEVVHHHPSEEKAHGS